MIKQHNFTCTQGVEKYVDYDINPLTPQVGITDLGTYRRRAFFLDFLPLKYVDVNTYPYIDNTVEDRPTWFVIDPKNNDLYLDLPDDDYDFVVYYRKQIQDLFDGATPNTNEPELPENYHNILIYAGLASFAVFIGNSELFSRYQLMYDQMLGDLMREYLPSKTIRPKSII